MGGDREMVLWRYSQGRLRGEDGKTSWSLRDRLNEIVEASVCAEGIGDSPLAEGC